MSEKGLDLDMCFLLHIKGLKQNLLPSDVLCVEGSRICYFEKVRYKVRSSHMKLNLHGLSNFLHENIEKFPLSSIAQLVVYRI